MTADGVTLATNTAARGPTAARSTSAATRSDGETAAHRRLLVGAGQPGRRRAIAERLPDRRQHRPRGRRRAAARHRPAARRCSGNDVDPVAGRGGAARSRCATLRATGQRGAVVALEPSTGAHPGDGVRSRRSTRTTSTRDFSAVLNRPGAPLLNRATQGLYPPGSTFKVVTAAAALEPGTCTPDSEFKGGQCVKTQGPKLCNASGEVAPDPNDARRRPRALLQHDVRAGRPEARPARARSTRCRRSASSRRSRSTTRATQMATRGLYTRPGQLPTPTAAIDVGARRDRPGRLLATPLQMALVTASIANGGVMMAPRVTARCASPSGRVVQTSATRTMRPAGVAADGRDAGRDHAARRRRGHRRRPRRSATCRWPARPAPRRPAARIKRPAAVRRLVRGVRAGRRRRGSRSPSSSRTPRASAERSPHPIARDVLGRAAVR